MKPTTQTFNPRNLPIKEEIEKDNGTPTDTTLSYDDQKGYTYVYREDASLVESTRPDQDYTDIERKQAELSEMIVTKQPEVSYLAISRLCSLEMWCHTHHS